jgi:glucokinase
MNRSGIRAVGIDFGGTTIKSAAVEGGRILARGRTIDTLALRGPEATVHALCNVVAELRQTVSGTSAIGIGVPGIVDSVNGVVHDLSNVPGWRDVALRDWFSRETGLPVMIENDANAMAFAEWRYGAGRDATNLVCVTLGTGVGGGLILNGQLYRGSGLGAGELGQMTIDADGAPGHYGNFGALEEYVGNVQICERALGCYQENGIEKKPDECTPAALAGAANAGDAIALSLWQHIGSEIGAALASVVWLLNPDCVVIGGGIANAGDLLFEPIRKTVRERTMPVFWEKLQIVPAQLGTDAGIIGAAALALEEPAPSRVED